MVKVTYIISDVNKALAFEWIATYIDRKKFDVSFILLNSGPSVLEDYLKENGITVHYVHCKTKKDWPTAWWKVFRILKKTRPDAVHCHLFTANIIGLSAAKMAAVRKRIYTRHHSTLHHVYFKKGILWDKMCNRFATKIIAITTMVKNVLLQWEHADPKKVVLIPHGFLLEEFRTVPEERVQAFRQRYDLKRDDYVVGIISRFVVWKGIQYAIPAFRELLKIKPNAILILLNAQGDFENEVKNLLSGVSPGNYRLIVFENDIAAAYKAMDQFIHVPIDEHSEAFGQIYIEALAAGIPSIFTLSGIAGDMIVDGHNAIVVPFKDSEAIAKAMVRIATEPALAARLSENGYNSVKEEFTFDKMIRHYEKLYAE